MTRERRAGLGIAVRRVGGGPRPALILHCSLAHSGALVPLAERLADTVSATLFDLPGHGRSDDRPDGMRMQDAAVAVAKSLLADMPGPCDLVGHSFGGTCLLRVAYETPEFVRTLTLIEPPFYDAARAVGDPDIDRQLARDAEFARCQAAGDAASAARAFIAEWGAGRPWEEMTEEQRAYVTDRIHLVEDAGNTLNADRAGMTVPGGLEGIGVPVLLIRGARSPVGIVAVHRALLARLPAAREVVIAEAGHMAPVTHPGEVASAIDAFLRETAPGVPRGGKPPRRPV